jgi:uncharacterized cupin superfamily protein
VQAGIGTARDGPRQLGRAPAGSPAAPRARASLAGLRRPVAEIVRPSEGAAIPEFCGVPIGAATTVPDRHFAVRCRASRRLPDPTRTKTCARRAPVLDGAAAAELVGAAPDRWREWRATRRGRAKGAGMATMTKPEGPIAIDSVPWTEWRQGVRFESRYRVLSDTRTGGRKIGVSYEELPPGKQSVPFHYHMLEEEHIIALEGEATLRLGEERHRIRAGAYVGVPAGQRAGHCLINDSDAPFRFLMIGDREPNEVCVYPDSAKVLVSALGRAVLRDGERLDYWDGERTDEPVTG